MKKLFILHEQYKEHPEFSAVIENPKFIPRVGDLIKWPSFVPKLERTKEL